MTPTRRTAMLITTLAAWPWITGFGWPQFFDLSWDEEVQLHDGRVIVVHLKFTYERLSSFSRHDNSILRDTEMSFDAGPPHGRVTRLFRRQRPVMLDAHNGAWYVVLNGLGGSPPREENWGPVQNSSGHRVGRLDNHSFDPIPIDFLPAQFDRPNLLIDYGSVSELVQFNSTLVTLKQKDLWLSKHPLGPIDKAIDRPHPSVFEQLQSKGSQK